MNLLEISDTQYQKLKKSYLEAMNNKKEQFEIEGQTILTKFCKYWLQAIEDNKRIKRERIYEPKIHDKTCKNCGYTWTSRKEEPVSCPNCKIRIDNKVKP